MWMKHKWPVWKRQEPGGSRCWEGREQAANLAVLSGQEGRRRRSTTTSAGRNHRGRAEVVLARHDLFHNLYPCRLQGEMVLDDHHQPNQRDAHMLDRRETNHEALHTSAETKRWLERDSRNPAAGIEQAKADALGARVEHTPTPVARVVDPALPGVHHDCRKVHLAYRCLLQMGGNHGCPVCQPSCGERQAPERAREAVYQAAWSLLGLERPGSRESQTFHDL